MPGLYGFLSSNGTDGTASAEALDNLLQSGAHHPDHAVEGRLREGGIASGLLLRRGGTGGGHCIVPGGIHVWLDGEAYGEHGPLPFEETAARLAHRDLPHALNGNFAAVLLDPARNLLRFVTDPFGLKYLYLRAEPEPAWCGELSGFLALPGAPPALDPGCARQILRHGHPLGGATWFQGVELLEPGLVVTFDRNAGTWSRQRYVRFEDLRPARPVRSREHAAAETGRLVRRAVERRAAGSGRPGITLSGGLDSRALLAALPAGVIAETVTFGVPGCADVRIAARAAAVRGAPHAAFPLGDEGWLRERARRVPLTDGHISILDLHGMEWLPEIESRMDVCLHGFLGDALTGGSYLDRKGFSLTGQYRHRGRRFILQALHYGGTRLIYRTPFLDLELAGMTLSLPREWLRGSRLYNAALLREFPEYFRDIPWERTGLPISSPPWRLALRRGTMRAQRLLQRASGRGPSPGYADYPGWMRRGADADYLRSHLDRDALLHRLVPPEETVERLRGHFAGADHSADLGRRLTIEIWLRFLRDRGVQLS